MSTKDEAADRVMTYLMKGFQWSAVILVLMLTVIGLLYLTRGTAVRRVRGLGAEGIPVAPDEPAFPLMVALLTGAPIVAGNRVELVLDGEVFPRLWMDLREAKTSITLQVYYAQEGEVSDALAEILSDRSRAGVSPDSH